METVTEMAAKDVWTAEDYNQLVAALFRVGQATDKFAALTAKMEAAGEAKGPAALKLGIAYYILCRFDKALAALANATDNKERRFFQAMALKNLRQYAKADEEFERAKARGWDEREVEAQRIEILVLTGDVAAAKKAMTAYEKKASGTPDAAYLRGLLLEQDGAGEKACEAYDQARTLGQGHPRATFRLAYYCDLHGDTERAMELYRECISAPPVFANALLNLAVLYEDAGDYGRAGDCLRRILVTQPNHERAKLFLKDVEASKTMFFDEDQAKRIAHHNAILDIPVTDFELSVRARNCLKKMNIRVLGDLVRTTESELLGYKNFGETSLKEIKDMLSAKGLRLGQALEDEGQAPITLGLDIAPETHVASCPPPSSRSSSPFALAPP
ncbi:MAG: tetratricopeptide repeat protein [Planctomycetota bacterium]|nr:tetratricopeptide repeat protein [Planctomycetota bacterium]